MLNISANSVKADVLESQYSSLVRVNKRNSGKKLTRLLLLCSLGLFIFMFVPWTQYVRTKGKVTTLTPQQRPQMIPSVIDGRIENWFVLEGDFVNKGDTILHISEIKDDYFDSQLINRTQNQINAKTSSRGAYSSKAEALNQQLFALAQDRDVTITQANNKLEQARLKVVTDSIDLEAKKINLIVANKQFERLETLFAKGLKSRTELEKRQLQLQKAVAEKTAAENKLLTSRAGAANAIAELAGIEAQFQKEAAKIKSDRFGTLSGQFETEVTISKLENQLSNYTARQSFYYITAPQNGFITKTFTNGIGETVKQGTPLVSIMPQEYELAIEMFVEPLDLPLLEKGQVVRIIFDGWPAVIFSGWPNTSYGTFGGEIFAIDNFISDNGRYRIMVRMSPDEPWPDLLRVGGGAKGLILLKDVPIWYELWRNLNGFPPDFYKDETKLQAATQKRPKLK